MKCTFPKLVFVMCEDLVADSGREGWTCREVVVDILKEHKAYDLGNVRAPQVLCS